MSLAAKVKSIKLPKLNKGSLWFLSLLSISFFVAFFFTFIISKINLDVYESYFYDFRIRTNINTKVHPDIVLVTWDKKTSQILGKNKNTNMDVPFCDWPCGFDNHLKLDQFLAQGNPKAVGHFYELDDKLVSADSQSQDWINFVGHQSNYWFVNRYDHNPDTANPVPIWMEKVNSMNRGTTWDRLSFAKDQVSRRSLLFAMDESRLPVKLAEYIVGKPLDPKNIHNAFQTEMFDAFYININYAGDTREPQNVFPNYSVIDILEGKINPDVFKNKVVLIGRFDLLHRMDVAFTPYGSGNSENSFLTVNAHIINTIAQNNAISAPSTALSFFLTFLISCLSAASVLILPPVLGLLSMFLILAFFTVCSLVSFWYFYEWVPMAGVIIASIATHYVIIPVRFLIEYRRRSFFEKRNETLKQVEELKSNFLSLMSHNLKTPVARILGLAEVVTNKGGLNKDQTEAADEIKNSSEELNGFINQILKLSKIESSDIKFHPQSKDINKLIESCVRPFSFHLKKKNMKLSTNLEPLFPVNIDPELFNQILQNLIDNAIKYSPENSEIQIRSREENEKIVIDVIDQGLGISEEDLKNIFQKFYRSTSNDIRTIKGSGLGLYLVDYFIKLHQGCIKVDSKLYKGSTFTIELPVKS